MPCPRCGSLNTHSGPCPREVFPADPLTGGVVDTWLPSSSAHAGFTGTLLAERFQLEGLLGRGAAGIVYRAVDLVLNETVALKLLDLRSARDDEDVMRFKREIVIARRITHPNVIRIHDFGMVAQQPFISMELLEGGTLSRRLSSSLLSIGEAIRIGSAICDGLAAAHKMDVVHRDVKPENVLFDASDEPKLVDFGIARFASAEITSAVVGTPYYMSPEQCDGGEVTERSDLYSVGVTLYEMFSGCRPFRSDSIPKLIAMHCREQPAPPREHRAEIPAAIEEVILEALAKDPSERPAATEIAARLRAARTRGIAKPPPSDDQTESAKTRLLADDKPTQAPLDATAIISRPELEPPRRAPSASWPWLVAAAMVLLAAVAATMVPEWRSRARPISVPTPARIARTPTPDATIAHVTFTPERTAPRATPTVVARSTQVAATPRMTPTLAATATLAVVATATPTVVRPVQNGTLTVIADPGVDQIFIDDQAVSIPPPRVRLSALPLPAGVHRVRLVHRALGYDKTLQVEISAGHEKVVRVSLRGQTPP